MTAQISERLVYRRRRHPLLTNPLEHAFERGVTRPPFDGRSSACWRGYVGTWAVRRDRLYLTALDARRADRPFGLRDLFPGAPAAGVPADWCSDWLRVPLGKQLHYVHMGYGSTYERDRYLGVRDGRLVYLEEIENRPTGDPRVAEPFMPAEFERRVVGRELTPRAEDVYGRDEAAFLRGVVANPDDDTARLVYADWLDERGDPRAGLIRLEAVRAALPPDEFETRRTDVLATVKDWLWLRIMNYPWPRDEWGVEHIDW